MLPILAWSENMSTENLCGNGDLISHFNFWKNRKYKKQLDITCNLSKISYQNDFISVYKFAYKHCLSFNFRLNSLRNISKSAAEVNFQSHLVFNNKYCLINK